jgi:1,4-dihydroxy-2-naphthoate octaprenyltransferase
VCREEKILWRAAAAGCERDRFRVSLSLFYLSKLPPPPVALSIGPVFIGKMLHGSQNWSLNFLSFFVNLIFLNFFVFFENEQYQR